MQSLMQSFISLESLCEVWKQTLEKELDLWCCRRLGVAKDAPLEAFEEPRCAESKSVVSSAEALTLGSAEALSPCRARRRS